MIPSLHVLQLFIVNHPIIKTHKILATDNVVKQK
jgi:hypothetical protein